MLKDFITDEKGRALKIAVIVWTVDPEGEKRFLLRHNKPFDGYEDEWTIAFGNVEPDEEFAEAAKREIEEEFGIAEFEKVLDLEYESEYVGKRGQTVVHYFAIKVKNLDVKIILNEESIGYDWMKFEGVKKAMVHEDEFGAFEKFVRIKV